jgi:hypothetical protein
MILQAVPPYGEAWRRGEWIRTTDVPGRRTIRNSRRAGRAVVAAGTAHTAVLPSLPLARCAGGGGGGGGPLDRSTSTTRSTVRVLAAPARPRLMPAMRWRGTNTNGFPNRKLAHQGTERGCSHKLSGEGKYMYKLRPVSSPPPPSLERTRAASAPVARRRCRDNTSRQCRPVMRARYCRRNHHRSGRHRHRRLRRTASGPSGRCQLQIARRGAAPAAQPTSCW